MDVDEALVLIEKLKGGGVEFRQVGRSLHATRGGEKVSDPMRDLISRHWVVVARAVSAHRQTQRAIERARRVAA